MRELLASQDAVAGAALLVFGLLMLAFPDLFLKLGGSVYKDLGDDENSEQELIKTTRLRWHKRAAWLFVFIGVYSLAFGFFTV
jgi:uncharacterized membrane protein HdeD (DUF308 family)